MKYVLSLVLLASLAGCSENSAIEDAVTERLKDPDSAKFGEISTVEGPGGKWGCATVNARNTYGGYTGDQQVLIMYDNNTGWTPTGNGSEISHEHCMETAQYMANDIKEGDDEE